MKNKTRELLVYKHSVSTPTFLFMLPTVTLVSWHMLHLAGEMHLLLPAAGSPRAAELSVLTRSQEPTIPALIPDMFLTTERALLL